MEPVDILIHYLKEIEALDIPDALDVYLHTVLDPELVGRIQNAAATALIDSNGKNIWNNHSLLTNRGFYVFAGETDRFGWLTGCIQTKKGIIIYD